MEISHLATQGATAIDQGFRDHQELFLQLTRRAREHFEGRNWAGIRADTVERLQLHPRFIDETLENLTGLLAGRLKDHELWTAMKTAYTRQILGRDDFELALTFFNSLSRRIFPHVGVDPSTDYASDDFPVPYRGWEMTAARTYAVRRVEPDVVYKVLEDAQLEAPFPRMGQAAVEAARRIERGVREFFGHGQIDGIDVLRPLFFRNKGAYIVGRVRSGETVQPMPLILVLLHEQEGLRLDAVLHTEDEASVVFSFARWYFHVDLASPRHAIGFLSSILPRKRKAELYIALGYNKHGKTEFFRDLMGVIGRTGQRFEVAPGQRGLVMAVFTLPGYEFVFKVIKDHFPQQKPTTRRQVMQKYRLVLLHDRVGRLVDFQEFEHLTFPRARFRDDLLEELLEVAGQTVELSGDDVVVRHLYVGRRVIPLDIYLREASPPEAQAAVSDWGYALKDLAAADIFPGDMLLKNFGVTRHGRVVFYDYDELCPLSDCNFRRFPPARDGFEEMAAQPWFSVGENDVFPEEFASFMGLDGRLQQVFEAEHSDLFSPTFWREMQERNEGGEIIDFYPYTEARRLGSGRSSDPSSPPAEPGEPG